MEWLEEHDEICCRIYIEQIVLRKKSDKDICIKLAKIEGVPQAKGSVRMKFQNICYLFDPTGAKHDSPFTTLENYSAQNKNVFDKVVKDYNY